MAGENDIWTFDNSSGDWWWSRKASNGEIVGKSSQSYRNKASCEENATRNGYGSGPTHVSEDTWEIYQSDDDKYRWRRTASNGKIVGTTHQAYGSRAACVANAQRHGYPGD